MIGAGTYGNAGSARFGEGEGGGSANSLGSTTDEDVLSTEVGFATIDRRIRIIVLVRCVVISCNRNQSQVGVYGSDDRVPGPANGLLVSSGEGILSIRAPVVAED